MWPIVAEQFPAQALEETAGESAARILDRQRKVDCGLSIALLCFFATRCS
ncbi:MAG: hypothetical protein JOZ52_04800 [Acidobacteria bacterium]|nr:hypothetical protein [Acidobacteriota bacterium]